VSWYGIEGHDAVVERFRNSLAKQRMASTFLFVGPPGIGKRKFAFQLAQCLLCPNHQEAELLACEQCDTCKQVAAQTHPDVDYLCRPDGAANIPIELLIGARERRMREGLCYRISLKPNAGRRRIAIIDDADHLAVAGANSLLKTLEEPPSGAVIILIGTSEQRQLPTIRSRCQVVRFQSLADPHVVQYLKRRNETEMSDADDGSVELDDATIAAIVQLSGGSLQRAREFANPGLTKFEASLDEMWNRHPIRSLAIAEQIQAFLKPLGNDTAGKRSLLERLVQLRINRLRAKMMEALGDNDDRVQAAIASQIERCLDSLQQIRANANLATLVECWVDDLYQLEPTK